MRCITWTAPFENESAGKETGGKEEDPTAALKRNEDDSAKLEGGSGAGEEVGPLAELKPPLTSTPLCFSDRTLPRR